MKYIYKNFFSATKDVAKRSTVAILCTLVIGFFLSAASCDKLRNSQENGASKVPENINIMDTTTNIIADTIYSNIEDLYAQPLHIIQACIQGKWKVLRVSRWGYLGLLHPTNTIVTIDIQNSNVVITEDTNEHYMMMDGCLNNLFSFSWENKGVYPFGIGTRSPCYTTYVMQNNLSRKPELVLHFNEKVEGWYFDKIINDTLQVIVDYHPDTYYCESYLFLRIKDNNQLKTE